MSQEGDRDLVALMQREWRSRRCSPPSLCGGIEIMSSEIILTAKVAEEACETAVNDPSNLGARADLLNAVEAFVEAAGQKAGAKHSADIQYLLRLAAVLGNIVRSRIVDSRNSKTATTASLIRHPSRELQQLLTQLLDALKPSACSSG
jgi:hypothetical protein